MQTLRAVIGIGWVVFWVYWLLMATRSSESVRGTGAFGRGMRVRGIAAIAAIVIFRVFRGNSTEIHSVAVAGIGTGLFACGLSICIWARLYLGTNWGMPTSQRVAPELITGGPYRFVRHPIYSGLLLALTGTVLATNLLGFIAVVIAVAYFYYAARIEEQNMTSAFPEAYPAYRERSKMLIPWIL